MGGCFYNWVTIAQISIKSKLIFFVNQRIDIHGCVLTNIAKSFKLIFCHMSLVKNLSQLVGDLNESQS